MAVRQQVKNFPEAELLTTTPHTQEQAAKICDIFCLFPLTAATAQVGVVAASLLMTQTQVVFTRTMSHCPIGAAQGLEFIMIH